jgi:predicted aspartyl protease
MARPIHRRQSPWSTVLGCLAALLLLPGCAAWILAPMPADLEMPDHGADLGVELCSGMLWVDVTLDGHGPYAFLLDTGAQITVLDAAVAQEAFPERVRSTFLISARGAQGRRAPIDGRVRIRELAVGQLVARDLDAIVMDLSKVGHALGRRFDGVVGYPVFHDALLVVDYGAGRGHALPHGADAGLPEDSTPIRLLPGSEPEIELEVSGRTLRFLVDTGASTRFTVEHLDAVAEGPYPVIGMRRGVDGDAESPAARLDGAIDLGPLRYERPIVHGGGSGNKIGGRAFADARIAFDQRRRELRVEPADDEPIRMPPFHHLDVVFEKLDDGWMPSHTLSGAPLGDLGLRESDRVITVDGTPITDLVCVRLEEVLEDRTVIEVTVVRDGSRVDVPLTVLRRLVDN